jgi:hypothetical protein
MDFSFCINTFSDHNKNHSNFIPQIISSIEEQNVPNYEILIIGDYITTRKNVRCIPFDETQKMGWITRKKNILTKEAKYNNLCFLHDYIYFLPKWYEGWLKYGNEWDIGLNVIINNDGTRFRDLVVLDDLEQPGPECWWHKNLPSDPNEKPVLISPYIPSYNYNKMKHIYISGSYWIAKKYVMEQEPLNERYIWGMSEDLEWSMRVRQIYHIAFNTLCGVKLLKYKDIVWPCKNPYYLSHNYITKDFVS